MFKQAKYRTVLNQQTLVRVLQYRFASSFEQQKVESSTYSKVKIKRSADFAQHIDRDYLVLFVAVSPKVRTYFGCFH